MQLFYFLLTLGFISIWSGHLEKGQHKIITSIVDNGCSSHQDLSQTKSNADVYNYAALSTSY